MREFTVAATFSAAVLSIFMIFVAAGWPGAQNSCVTDRDGGKRANTCYCEPFVTQDIGKPGVRQPFNTWSNLYALLTGAGLALAVYLYRRGGLPSGSNRMRSTHFYPLLYIPVVIFLGLGSMWFHASLTQWGGVFDNLSMYTFTNFLIFYTIVRLTNVDLLFYIGYPVATAGLTFAAVLGASSLIVCLFSVATYFIFEGIIWLWKPDVRNDWPTFWKFWVPGVASILISTVLWVLSQTDAPLCFKTHLFQFHGVWHMGAGASALFLYCFWRNARR
jgi:hypothetical protein